MSRRIAIVTALATLGLALVVLTFIPPHAIAQIGSTSGFVVDQTYDAVWGYVSPGTTVTVARGTAYGAAQADGVGLFWTPLWQSNGQPADIADGDTIQVYVNGSLSATITVSGVTGLVDVLNDRVVGTINGVAAPIPVTVTLGTNPGVPSASATTDASGRFTATFTTVDLNPGQNAVVEYRNGPHALRASLAPFQVFAVGLGWNSVGGYAQPGQAITATVYAGSGPTVKTVMTGQANEPQGYYDLKPSDTTVINGGDVVKVNLGSGVIISTTAVTITMHTNPTTDLVTGTAPAGAALRASLSQWTDDKNLYYQVTTIADATGVYTANFSGVADVQVYDWIGVAVADSKGNETNLWSGAPMISVDESDNSVWARVDGPNLAVAATLDTGSGTFTQTGMSGLHHYVNLSSFPGEPDIQPGHHITVETVSWMGVITVANLSASLDTAGNRLLGDAPAGRAQAEISHAWSDRYPAGLGRIIQQITATSPFTLAYADFDVRDGNGIWLTSHDSNGFDTGRWIDSRVFQVQVPNGVGVPQFSPSDVLTATLYASDGVTVKRQTSQDNDPNSTWYWMEMNGEIAVGDWVTVTDGAGWTAGLQVPDLTGQANAATDLIWGKGPKSLLLVQRNWDWQSARFVPCDDYKLDAAYFGEDLLSSDRIQTTYFALNGNSVVREFEFPWMRVNYGDDWVGATYPAEHTFWITVTNGGGTVKATAAISTTPGGGWGGDGFETRGENWSPSQPDIAAGDWVYVWADDGYTSTVHVGTITGNVSATTDSISGTITANWFTQTLDVECHAWGAPGGAPAKNSTAAPDGSAPYFCQWNPLTEWDILPGQNVAVMYIEPDRDRVINVFHESAPNLRVEKWVEGGGEATPSGSIVFGIRYQNNGDGAGEAILTDTLPLSTTYVTDTSGFPAFVSGNVITWNLGSVQPYTLPVQFQLVLTNSASPGDMLNNQVDIGAQYEMNWGDNHAEAQVQVGSGQPDLHVDKNPNPGDPAPDQLFRYRINYGNNGPVASGPVWLTDTLPLSTTFVSWQSENGYSLWTTVVTTGGKVALYAPTLPGNYGDTIFLTLRLSSAVSYGTQLINTIEITTTGDSNPDDNQQVNDWAWASPPRYDVSGDKSWGYGALTPGGEINYNLNYNNDGNSPVHNAVVTDTLPAGATFITSVIDLGWGLIDPFPPSLIVGNQLVWNLGTLEVNAHKNWRIALQSDPATPVGTIITNCATLTVSEWENNPYDNTRCAAETVRAAGTNLRVTKFAEWQGQGGLRYRVKIENIGTKTVDNVTITDTFPVSMTLNNRNVEFWEQWSSGVSGNQLTVTLIRLEPGWTTWLNMQMGIPSVPNGTLFTNTVEMTTPPDDVNPDDNHSDTVVGTGPDLSIEKSLTGGSSTPMPGDLLTYTLHFQNESEWQLAGTAWMTDVLPIGLEFVTSTQRLCGGGTYFCPRTPDYFGGTRLAWSIGTLGNYEWNDIIVAARVTDTAKGGAVFTNTAIIASDNPASDAEPNTDNNTSAVAVTVLSPVFQVGKIYQSSRVAGTPVTYTLTVTNTGNDMGTNVSLIDWIPSWIEYGGGGDGYSAGLITWTIPSIAPNGGTATRWFTGTLSAANVVVTNQYYRVSSSDQGVTSTDGLSVTFTTLAPTIAASFDYAPKPALIVVSDTVYFTDTSTTNGPPIVGWLWTFGDSALSAARHPSHRYTTVGTYTVSLLITDSLGYTATQSAPNAIVVRLACESVTGLGFVYAPMPIVVQQTTTFTATYTSGVPAPTFAWSVDGGAATAGPSLAYTFTTTGTHTVALTATNTCGAVPYTAPVNIEPRRIYLPVIKRP